MLNSLSHRSVANPKMIKLKIKFSALSNNCVRFKTMGTVACPLLNNSQGPAGDHQPAYTNHWNNAINPQIRVRHTV